MTRDDILPYLPRAGDHYDCYFKPSEWPEVEDDCWMITKEGVDTDVVIQLFTYGRGLCVGAMKEGTKYRTGPDRQQLGPEVRRDLMNALNWTGHFSPDIKGAWFDEDTP